MIAVSVNVYTEDSTAVLKCVEVLSRAAAGIALEGIDVSVNVHQLDTDEDES